MQVAASGLPVTVMAGILAEAETTTLRVPGRWVGAWMLGERLPWLLAHNWGQQQGGRIVCCCCGPRCRVGEPAAGPEGRPPCSCCRARACKLGDVWERVWFTGVCGRSIMLGCKDSGITQLPCSFAAPSRDPCMRSHAAAQTAAVLRPRPSLRLECRHPRSTMKTNASNVHFYVLDIPYPIMCMC